MTRKSNLFWTCPRCGRKFVSRDMEHACRTYPLEAHFEGCDPALRALFQQLEALFRECGPVTVESRREEIAFNARREIAGAVMHPRWMEVRLWLDREARHPALREITSSAGGFAHSFRIRTPEEMDPAFQAMVREAYDLGRQARPHRPLEG